MKESGNKDQVIRLRVSGAERDMFEAKAANYGSISAMIRDAVAHYDDTLMKRRIESMNLLYPLISKHESDLNRIGNNLNQVAHYCNLLAENNGRGDYLHIILVVLGKQIAVMCHLIQVVAYAVQVRFVL